MWQKLFGILFVVLFVTPVGAVDYSYVRIAGTDTIVPGSDKTFERFSQPVLGETETIFTGSSGFQRGIYSIADGDLSTIVDLSTPIPDGNGNFRNVGFPSHDDGQTVFWGKGKSGQSGIYLHDEELLTRIVDLSMPIPNGSGNFTSVQNPSVNGPVVSFWGAGNNRQYGIYSYSSVGDSSGISKVADLNTVLPGAQENFTLLGAPAQGEQSVAFSGRSASNGGIFTYTDGNLASIADYSTLVPGGTAPFDRFENPAIDNGQIVFLGGNENEQGIYSFRDGKLSTVVDWNTSIPGGEGTFSYLGSPSINDGQIAFWGTGSGSQAGIYMSAISVDGLTELIKVVDRNDTPGGELFTSFGLSPQSIYGDAVGFGSTTLFRAVPKTSGPVDPVAPVDPIDPNIVQIVGSGGVYNQDFDIALSAGGLGTPLPNGWSTIMEGQPNDTISQAFPPTVPGNGTFNVGDRFDRALAIESTGDDVINEIQFSVFVSEESMSALRISLDIEAWGGHLSAALPGEAAFDIILEAGSELSGFVQLANFGKQSTGTTLAPGLLDGNDERNNERFDSGIVEVSIPPSAEIRLRLSAAGHANSIGYIYGVDNVVLRSLLPGDTNGDGVVLIEDAMNILAAQKFGQGDLDASWSEGDFDQDDDVDMDDLIAMLAPLSARGQSSRASLRAAGDESAVPEVRVDPVSGSVTLDYVGQDILSIVVDSAAGIFNGPNAPFWDGATAFVIDSDNQLSNLTFSSPFNGVDDLGSGIINADLGADFDLAADLTARFLRFGSSATEEARVVVVPEPATSGLLLLGIATIACAAGSTHIGRR